MRTGAWIKLISTGPRNLTVFFYPYKITSSYNMKQEEPN